MVYSYELRGCGGFVFRWGKLEVLYVDVNFLVWRGMVMLESMICGFLLVSCIEGMCRIGWEKEVLVWEEFRYLGWLRE